MKEKRKEKLKWTRPGVEVKRQKEEEKREEEKERMNIKIMFEMTMESNNDMMKEWKRREENIDEAWSERWDQWKKIKEEKELKREEEQGGKVDKILQKRERGNRKKIQENRTGNKAVKGKKRHMGKKRSGKV